MAKSVTSNGYSAHVTIELHVNGQRIPVAQIGGGRLILQRPVPLPECNAEIVMHIDGHERRWRVDLHPPRPPQPHRSRRPPNRLTSRTR